MPDFRRIVAICVIAVAAVALVSPGFAARATDIPVPRPVLALPVPESRIVRLASLPDERWHPGHRGIDIDAGADAVVVAPSAGAVTFVGDVAGRGVVTITLDVGVTVTLEPVTANVAEGDRVALGQSVGTVAATPGHCAPRTCVHWGVKHGEVYLDPLDWLVGFGPIVLLE